MLAFGAIYGIATFVVAARRPLWNDELYTYHFARVPDLADLWRALQTGADQSPPLAYLLTRASLDLFGTSAVAIRLPEVVGFFVFSVCMYVFVARRTNELYGVIAMLLPSLTAAYYYASEARAYALVLAFGALALVCWQLATEGVRRRIDRAWRLRRALPRDVVPLLRRPAPRPADARRARADRAPAEDRRAALGRVLGGAASARRVPSARPRFARLCPGLLGQAGVAGCARASSRFSSTHGRASEASSSVRSVVPPPGRSSCSR